MRVDERGGVNVDALAVEFGVSLVTIRKDLAILASEHRLLRTRGGAVSATMDRLERQFEIRDHRELREKQAIARAAADLIGDDQVIALDAGTTALHVARAIKGHRAWRHLRIVTNGIPLAIELSRTPGIEVLMLGGRVRGGTLSVVDGRSELGRVPPAFDVAFLGAAGLTLDAGLIETTAAEAGTKRDLVAAAARVVAIVDHTKLGRAAIAPFCPIDSIGLVLTDSGARPEFLERLRQLHVTVQVAYPAGDA